MIPPVELADHLPDHAIIGAATPQRPCAVSERTCTDGHRIVIVVEAPALTQADARPITLRVRACFPAVTSYFTTPPVRLVVRTGADGVVQAASVSSGANTLDDSLAGGAVRAVLDPACAPWPLPPSLRRMTTDITLRFEDCCAAMGDFDALPTPPTAPPTGVRPR